MNDFKEGKNIIFEEFFCNLNVIEENCKFVLCLFFSFLIVFLKRELSELRINNYNVLCFCVWRVNMDI